MATIKRQRQKSNRDQNRLAAAETTATNVRQRQPTFYGVLAIIVVVVVASASCGNDETETGGAGDAVEETSNDDTATDLADTADTTDTTERPISEGCPAEDGSSPRTIDFAESQPMCINPNETHIAVFDTSEGEIRVELHTENAPVTVNNFVTLARWGYYDGTTFFRTDPSIDIIQGGGPHTESPSDPGPGYTIQDEPEFDLDPETGQMTGPYRYVPGQLVMARTGAPNSSSAQFFFTTGTRAALLDGQGVYVVFGETDEAGLGVLQSVIGLHEPGGALGGAPSRTVTVNSVTIEVN
ncbi:MAG: peptidylprolyl isomerase [Acidimicrobiaceae bacterium]|nr:peptidylprolyl isomerase [Acidimicrobiaceae bacterium]MBT5581425.1 peptidylprolyl isomerase [Acidimicrobiaceae bacterium]MBT5849938.1 peptidylprolyl isomerase [Acidimicrobiaceae bacterium]